MYRMVADKDGGKAVSLLPEEVEEFKTREKERQEFLAKEGYKKDRKEEYGSVIDQLDMMYWDEVNGTKKWSEHITAVKKKYPKPI